MTQETLLQSIIVSTWRVIWPWKMQKPLFSQVVVNINRLIIYQNVCHNIPYWFVAHICNYHNSNLPEILQSCYSYAKNYNPYFRLMMWCEYFRYCIVSYTEGKIIQSVSISYIMSQIKEIESETIIIFA